MDAFECSVDLNSPIEGEITAPGLVIPHAGEHTLLSWHNARLRTFRDEQFNHLEYRLQRVDPDTGKLVGRIGGGLTGRLRL